jgi:hypothetical protein
MLTKDHATAIARKLRAVMISGRKHDIATIKYDGLTVAQFGIRRGSRRDQSHDYIPSQIHVTRQQATLLAQCPMSFEQWVAIMKEKGRIKG